MKTSIIIILGVLAMFLFVQANVVKSSDKTEQQKYEVVEEFDGFEIRYYPEAVLASVFIPGDYRNSSGQGFRILAGYIFGGNHEKQNIAMTAPVHMKEDNKGFYMSFVMPSQYDINSLPIPDNSEISIEKSVPAYTAAIRFGGYANDEKIEAHKALLAKHLKEHGIEFTEPFVYLGYNPPYQTVNRRNEVAVKIEYPMEKSL